MRVNGPCSGTQPVQPVTGAGPEQDRFSDGRHKGEYPVTEIPAQVVDLSVLQTPASTKGISVIINGEPLTIPDRSEILVRGTADGGHSVSIKSPSFFVRAWNAVKEYLSLK